MTACGRDNLRQFKWLRGLYIAGIKRDPRTAALGGSHLFFGRGLRMRRSGLAAACHCAADRCHCPGGKQACAKNNDHGRTDSLQHGRSCAGGDLIHSQLLYKIPHCAVNKNLHKNVNKTSVCRSLYKIADRIYIYSQLSAESCMKIDETLRNSGSSKFLIAPGLTVKSFEESTINASYKNKERIDYELRFQRGRRI